MQDTSTRTVERKEIKELSKSRNIARVTPMPTTGNGKGRSEFQGFCNRREKELKIFGTLKIV